MVFFSIKSNSQVLTPYAFNMGGGFSNNNMLEWSMGESVSIANFLTSGYALNTGVLQPNTSIVTAINEYGPAVFGSQITIGPNPTSNIIHFKGNFNTTGNLKLQLIDANANILITQNAGIIFNSYESNFSLEKYSSGIFYIKVYFKPNVGNTKNGIYKIIKL